jgi:hypothetical protein
MLTMFSKAPRARMRGRMDAAIKEEYCSSTSATASSSQCQSKETRPEGAGPRAFVRDPNLLDRSRLRKTTMSSAPQREATAAEMALAEIGNLKIGLRHVEVSERPPVFGLGKCVT